MKILYIHQYFRIPAEGGAIRSYYLAKGLISQNFDVELITSHNKERYEVKIIEGIKVHYLPVPYLNEMGYIRRTIAFIKFFLWATIKAFKIQNVDICYATSTPLTVGCISLILKKWKRIPYIFEVRDLWPEAPIQLGVIKNKIIKHLLTWLELKIYGEAKAIVALSPGIKKHIEKISNTAIYCIPNMADTELFKNSVNIDDPINDKDFVITYFGAVGRVNRVQSLLQIAKEARNYDHRIKFKIIGDGYAFSSIKNFISVDKLDNVEIHSSRNKEELQEILKTTDATYISYLDIPVLESSSPNKFFDSLASGKLLILNIKGWLLELVEENSCGIYVNPNLPDEFHSKILPFVQDKNLLKEYQSNSLKLGKELFSKEEQVKKLVNIFNTLK